MTKPSTEIEDKKEFIESQVLDSSTEPQSTNVDLQDQKLQRNTSNEEPIETRDLMENNKKEKNSTNRIRRKQKNIQ